MSAMRSSFMPCLLLLAAACGAAGCQRRTELLPAAADSSLHAPADSFATLAHEASDRWESGMNDEAAEMSARLVRQALTVRPNGPWPERARGVLDSLGIGAEAAGDARATVVNMFARSDPEGPSYPYLYWHQQDGLRVQPLESRGLHLNDVATHAFAHADTPQDSAQVAVLWSRRVGGGMQPQVMVWRFAHGRWDLLQSLGADSLGGTGSGEFAANDSSAELQTRTFHPAAYFDECPTCPHVYHARRFRWGAAGFARLDDRAGPSPYSTFTAFIGALVANDRERAMPLVAESPLIDFARRFDWQSPGMGRWRVAPATDETASQMVFFRGAKEAYRVTFESRDGDWVIAGFEPATRNLE